MIDSPASSTSTETKICIDCVIDQPINRFLFYNRKTGARHNQCNDCHAAYMQKLRAAKRNKRIRTFVREAPKQNSYRDTNALVANMIKQFGSVGRLADAWITAINARIKSNPGSKALLDSFRTLVHLMAIVDAGAPKNTALPDNVSEQDLTRIIREAMEADRGERSDQNS